jgi:uncharacterized protein (DUF849 family)
MIAQQKVILTCAVTGAIHTPSMSPHLPITPEQIAQQAIDASAAGAAVIHLHARDSETGRPDQRPEAFAPILDILRGRTDAIINITTGGSPYMLVEERVRPGTRFKPELASLNMGSFNFGLFPMLGRFHQFEYAWEREALEGSRDLIFRNTFKDIEYVISACRDNGTRFEFECYDVGHLYNLAHFVERKLVEPPFFVQTVFGILGGIGSHADDVSTMKRTADRLLGPNFVWSVLGTGRSQMVVAKLALEAGGSIRVGLEDSLWSGPGKLAKSNAEQVSIAKKLVSEASRELATAPEVREMLKLKGSMGG